MAHPSHSGRFPLVAILGLLSASVFISYVDRGNLSIAASTLQRELNLSGTELGVLLSSFFWTYTLVLSISGWVVDRFDVKWVLAIGFVIWSLATAATGAVASFHALLACRLLLGVGESVTFPSYSKILARHVPQENRALANAAIMSGMMAGPAVGTYVLGRLMAHYSWRPVFLVLGLASLAWVLPWLWLMPRTRPEEPRAATSVSVGEIVRQRSFWAASAGHFAGNYLIYFMISWLPYYLVNQRHESMPQMAFEAAMFYTAYAVVSPITGFIADLLIRSGRSVTRVRKTSMVLGYCAAALGVFGLTADDPALAFRSLLLMGAGCGVCGPNIYTFAQTLAGPVVAGKWIGFQNCLANLAGVIVAPLAGWVVDHTGNFRAAFIVSAIVSLVGAAMWSLGIGELKPVTWRAPTTTPAPESTPLSDTTRA